MVITELADSLVLGTNVGVCMRTDGVSLQVIPVGVPIGTTDTILNEGIVRRSDPETSRRLISVETTPAPLDLNDAVAVQVVLLLNGIFDEDVVALDFVSNIVHDAHVMSTVQRERSVEALMDGVVSRVRVVHSSDHVEMDRITADLEALTYHVHLNVGDSAYQRVITVRMQEDISTVFIGKRGTRITSEANVPR